MCFLFINFAQLYHKKMKIKNYILCILSLMVCSITFADDNPTVAPTASFTDTQNTKTESSYSGSAPVTGSFVANATDTVGWNCYYEWRFKKANSNEPYLVRYTENTNYIFTTTGSHTVVLYAKFTKGSNVVEYESDDFSVTISESNLEMPNAFSPNGDDINDLYKAKSNYKSIVDFKATIYNRWGHKLYSWTNIDGGWDGTFNGKNVKDGVYFVQVTATGADGIKYNIKRDVNLLRGYNKTTTE